MGIQSSTFFFLHGRLETKSSNRLHSIWVTLHCTVVSNEEKLSINELVIQNL